MKYRKPTNKLDIRVHFEKDSKDGKVWTVQFHDGKKWKYLTTKYIYIRALACTRYFEDKLQPRAVINVWHGTVLVTKNTITITNHP